MRLLIIEDNLTIRQNLKELLTLDSHVIDTAESGQQGLDKATAEEYDGLILDLMLPDIPGEQVCQTLRTQGSQTPILMLTAKSQDEDIVSGLDLGADDYLTKPFEANVLRARVRALLRRRNQTVHQPIIQIADLTIDTNTHQVTRASQPIKLSPKEYTLLKYLAVHQGQALTRIDILSHAWDENADPFSNTVDVHIRFLRKKLDDPFPQKLIQTIKGKGYMIAEEN